MIQTSEWRGPERVASQEVVCYQDAWRQEIGRGNGEDKEEKKMKKKKEKQEFGK